MKKYETEKEIFDIVRGFETGTIPRADWNHAGHLTVAFYYIINHGLEESIVKMRRNLLNHLKAVGVDFSKEMPYHETLTVFWLRTIEDFRQTKNDYSIVKLCNEILEQFDKNYPLKFYSRELLFSDEARAKFIDGDLVEKQ